MASKTSSVLVTGKVLRLPRNSWIPAVATTLAPCAPRFAPPSPEALGTKLKRLFVGDGQDWLVAWTDCGHSDGCCLLLAQCLKAILPESRVVTMLSTRSRGPQPDHYGVLWRGWYFDGSGGFPSAEAWKTYFSERYYIPLPAVEDRYVRSGDIPNQIWHRQELIAFLKEHLRA